MFVNEDYTNYHYLVETHDNYVVLSNSRSVNGDYMSPDTINVIYQYFYPSVVTLEGSYTSYNTKSFDSIDVDSDFYSRADCPIILISGFCVLLIVAYIVNGLTRLVRPHGILF